MADSRVIKKAKENREALASMEQKESLSDTFTQALVGFLPLIAGIGSSEDMAAVAPVGMQAMQQYGEGRARERSQANALNAQALSTAQEEIGAEDASRAAVAKEAALNTRQEKDLASKEKIASQGQKGQDDRLSKQLFSQMQIADKQLAKSGSTATNSFTSDLRKEYTSNPVTKKSIEISAAYDNVKNATETGVGDINSLYNFVKILDPESVVKEGEIQLSQSADPLLSKLTNLYKQKAEGRLTSPQFKKDLNEQIDIIMNSQMEKQAQVDSHYTGISTRSGALPENVINPAYKARPAVISKDQALAELARRKALKAK